MTNSIFLCFVGGAHQPILRAIESASPRYACFFCTDRDPGTGRPGSIGQAELSRFGGPLPGARSQSSAHVRSIAPDRAGGPYLGGYETSASR